MQVNTKIGLTLLAGVAIGAVAVEVLHAQATPPSYVVTDIAEISDPEGFKVVSQRPQAEAAARVQQAGGRYITRTDKITALDGAPPKRMIIIAFDSLEKAQAFNNSQGQKEINAIRTKTTKSRSFIVQGL
jgi:uncharacterized protein (DUF1330 family)